MSRSLHGGIRLDPREARQVEVTARALDLLPSGADAAGVFAAIRACVPLSAGLFCIIRPGAPDALMSHAVGLPPEVFESWLGTSAEQIARTLKPIVSSSAGDLWRDSETLTGAQREKLDVLRKLDEAGLGEGAGYKVLERATSWHGQEHYMLALLMERGQTVPLRSQAMLAALNSAIRAAALRIGLMLVAREPILTQLVEEQSLGYICISRTGEVLEANRRAHHLVTRYQHAAGIEGRRNAMTDFAARARERASGQQLWRLAATRPASLLEVNAHQLAKESHALPEDVVLVMLKEVFAPPAAALSDEPVALARLTPRQREIVLLVARTGDSYKEVAERLAVREGTVRKHVENIFSLLGVHSRAELTVLFR